MKEEMTEHGSFTAVPANPASPTTKISLNILHIHEHAQELLHSLKNIWIGKGRQMYAEPRVLKPSPASQLCFE